MMELEEKTQEVTRLLHEMLAACKGYVANPTDEGFRAWRAATAAYIAKHREWFALAMPDLDYDTVYGGVAR